VGAGVYVFKKTRQRRKHTNQFEWDMQSGLGYQFLRLISTVPGVGNPQNDDSSCSELIGSWSS
jgi:hypothetical protein